MARLTDRIRRVLQKPGTIDIRPYERMVERVGARAEAVGKLSDDELRDAAATLRTGEAFTDNELVELLAVAREAAERAIGERPFDCQLVGALALLQGRVIEMATGEGKTLAGAIAAAGYVLSGRRVQVMAVNDYLANRDAEWMGPLYDVLGVTVSHVGQASTPDERREAYAAEVCYAPVSEVGFDVLRDRLAADAADRVTATPDVALVDEADSVLIDEARVPLVLAGAAAGEEMDDDIVQLVRELRAGVDYEVDPDGRSVALTDAGTDHVEERLGGIDLYEAEHLERLTQVNLALHADALLKRDVDYLVRDGKVHLVNTNRGRIARLQRWPDGLQAAVEAKEALAASESGEVRDSITVQALVSSYKTVCGMTGTAVVVGEALQEFYGVEVAVIPPNKPCVRVDHPDRLYLTVEDKVTALVGHITEVHETGRPILVGTHSVDESEQLSEKLTAAEIEHVVLNAKNDAEEAAIVAEAGVPGTVTVSTQMAGRGTDIRLGGRDQHDRDKAVELDGLYVIGTGRHPSSRLDDQLRGRAGRQGDPGGSVFFASLGDELITRYSVTTGLRPNPDDDGRLHDRKSHAHLEHAQRVADGANVEIHRNTWSYARLTGQQRAILLDTREKVLTGDLAATELAERRKERYDELVEEHGADVVAGAARQIALHHLDGGWTDHLAVLADLREGIHLRSLSGGIVHEKPIDEFNRNAIASFDTLVEDAWTAAAESFDTAQIGPDGLDAEASGVARPTATWTYLVNDNPFGTDADRILGRLRQAIKKTP
ncbi:MAG TPA: accessory Sec system translocase SecA2 [Kribbellaceae bacterium]|nr:accessory Sec system translocase SecA2 [Kribbellaceae bacterium]